MSEDDRVEIKMTLVLRGPAFLSKLLERGMEQNLADSIEEGVNQGIGAFDRGGKGELVQVWDVNIDYAGERKLEKDETQ